MWLDLELVEEKARVKTSLLKMRMSERERERERETRETRRVREGDDDNNNNSLCIGCCLVLLLCSQPRSAHHSTAIPILFDATTVVCANIRNEMSVVCFKPGELYDTPIINKLYSVTHSLFHPNTIK